MRSVNLLIKMAAAVPYFGRQHIASPSSFVPRQDNVVDSMQEAVAYAMQLGTRHNQARADKQSEEQRDAVTTATAPIPPALTGSPDARSKPALLPMEYPSVSQPQPIQSEYS